MGIAKVLFIVPAFGLGGTTTALVSLLNSKLTDLYDISIYAICRRNYTMPQLASHDIGINSLTTAYYEDFSSFSKKDKLKFFVIKLLKQNKKKYEQFEQWIIRQSIKKIEKRHHYNIVVGFQEGLATRFASHFACPHKIAWIHCDYANAYGKEVNELDLYKRFDNVVCVSQYTRKSFVERYPSLAEKTVAIHNLFDAERVITLSDSSVDDPRFDTSRFTIISIGRVHDVKRFYLIPEIAAKLKESGMAFRWYILGNADILNELQRLTDAIQRNGMEEYVIYLGGKPNPYPYFKAADLLVSVSKSEACPMIFNEAKLLQLPILSTDFGSAFEFIEQGKDGFVSSIMELPQQLTELMKQPSLLEPIKTSISVTGSNESILNQLKQLFQL